MSDYFDFHVKKELFQTALEAGERLPADVKAEVHSLLEQDLVAKGFDRENADEKTKKLANLYIDLHTGLFAMKWGIQTKAMKEIENDLNKSLALFGVPKVRLVHNGRDLEGNRVDEFGR